MMETSILSFIDPILIYRSRVLETRVPISKTSIFYLEIWRKTEEERFEARSEETKRRFEEEDLIWRGTIWSSDLPSKNEEWSDSLKNARKKKWNSCLKNSISTTRFLSWNLSFRLVFNKTWQLTKFFNI